MEVVRKAPRHRREPAVVIGFIESNELLQLWHISEKAILCVETRSLKMSCLRIIASHHRLIV